MNRRRVVLFGAAAIGAYVAVAGATLGLSGRRLLPLFEGVGPPPSYQWVNPPAAFAAGNTKPKPAGADIALTGGKSAQAAVATADGQCVVNFSAGAFAARGSDTSVRAAITPLDPAALGPVPAGLAADGNAYRIQFSYQPSNTPVDSVAAPSDIALTAPTHPLAMLYSSGGQSWTKLATQAVGTTSTAFSTFNRPGVYLVGASPAAVASGQHSSGLGTAVIAALVAGLAILLAATPLALRAIRRRRSRRRTGPPKRPGRPPANPPKPNRRR